MRSWIIAGAPGDTAFAGVILLALSAILILSPGCRSAASGGGPAVSYTAPDWDELGIRSLAFVGLGGVVSDAAARRSAEQIVDEELRSGQAEYVVFGPREARSRAEGRGVGAVFDRILRTWRDARTADQFLVRELCQAMGVDGIMFADLLEWSEETVSVSAEDPSATRVEIRVALYSGTTGQVAWEARSRLRKESVVHTHQHSGGVSVRAHRGERTSGLTPRPPRAEDVARELMQSILLALPSRSGD